MLYQTVKENLAQDYEQSWVMAFGPLNEEWVYSSRNKKIPTRIEKKKYTVQKNKNKIYY